VRVWQETRQNEFPDIERAAETVGRRRMPLSLEDVLGIVEETGLAIRWVDDERRGRADPVLRARYEAPGTVLINRKLRAHEARLKYTLAFFIGHRILHNGDGVVPPHSAAGPGFEEQRCDDASATGTVAGMAPRDVLLAWRDFECSAFAGALLCPKQPFRQFLVRERHELAAVGKLGVTEAVMMRRMTGVSPYRHWHFFDGYAPGYLRAVYRGNGIPLPWGNMSLVPDPCPNWAVFRLLRDTPAARAAQLQPVSQLSVMRDGGTPRLYCCHSLRTRDAADVSHVLSVGIDLARARGPGTRRRPDHRHGGRQLRTRRRHRIHSGRGRRGHSHGEPRAQRRLGGARPGGTGQHHLPAQPLLPAQQPLQRALNCARGVVRVRRVAVPGCARR
jgi:hypothetical protein